ncbi:MAG TPA: hypothetical protein VNJ01_12040 [Bacteriovoracaceae bacterium]|nr:hypothetical protein [Bacteriovoracaceae bacterium]
MIRIKNNWLHGPWFDSAFILLPAFLSVGMVYLLKDGSHAPLPLWMWVALVMGIDVSHVYSTLFKTYFHSEEFNQHRNLYTLVPVLVLLTGILVYTVDSKTFWTLLAYLAVFHFIRQQYGFLRLYARSEQSPRLVRSIDAFTIYSATLYPVIFWHTYPRDFNWFMEGDFLLGLPVVVERVAFVLYLLAIFTYLTKELYLVTVKRELNLGKNLIVFGTVCSWYVGIVLFNGDVAFTLTNVIAHGIPYMALVWVWGKNKQARHFNKSYGPAIFLVSILLFAYVEEGLWAGLVWREHLEAFAVFTSFPEISDKATLSWLVPLLTLPQATHYVLDGFIWKVTGTSRGV